MPDLPPVVLFAILLLLCDVVAISLVRLFG